jgi:predicted  nucleic acid-binding Zn-ribbon protein
LREEVERLNRKCNELETELANVKTERDDYAATVDEFIKDHKRSSEKALTPEKCSSILNALGVGKQSPQYKRLKAILDQFIKEAQGHG